jgi:hypothetical protein
MVHINTDDMTIDELRAYYDAGGANRLRSMDTFQQEDLFKKFIVSKSILSITQPAYIGRAKQKANRGNAQGDGGLESEASHEHGLAEKQSH